MNNSIRVLMVDDEEQFRATTKKLLTRRGFDMILAASGEEAVGKLSENPDVVVLDIKMPGMDGHEALKAIKARNPNLPVIMLTGHGAMPSAQEALSEGAFDYLSKPCDIDLLAGKITDAVQSGPPREARQENRVRDVMIPIENYTTLRGDQTVIDAIAALKESFASKLSTSRLMETGHRSILIFDEENELQGILSIRDLLRALMPAYLTAAKPSLADSIQYSPMFWRGMFQRATMDLADKRVEDIMSPTPLAIDGECNLMEAVYQMVSHEVRRLIVLRSGRVAGVIREQDLFFEMERIYRRMHR